MDNDSGIRTEQLADHVWLVTLTGEHDPATAPDLRSALAATFASGSDVLLDLTEATFIDSAIVSAIAAASEYAEQHPGDELLVIAPTATRPRRVLDLVNAGSFVSIYDGRDTALAALGW